MTGLRFSSYSEKTMLSGASFPDFSFPLMHINSWNFVAQQFLPVQGIFQKFFSRFRVFTWFFQGIGFLPGFYTVFYGSGSAKNLHLNLEPWKKNLNGNNRNKTLNHQKPWSTNFQLMMVWDKYTCHIINEWNCSVFSHLLVDTESSKILMSINIYRPIWLFSKRG